MSNPNPHPNVRPWVGDGEASRVLGAQRRPRWAWYLCQNLQDAAAMAILDLNLARARRMA